MTDFHGSDLYGRGAVVTGGARGTFSTGSEFVVDGGATAGMALAEPA